MRAIRSEVARLTDAGASVLHEMEERREFWVVMQANTRMEGVEGPAPWDYVIEARRFEPSCCRILTR